MNQRIANARSTVTVTKNQCEIPAILNLPVALAEVVAESREYDGPVLFGCADDAEPRLFRGVFFGLILSAISWAGVAVAVFC